MKSLRYLSSLSEYFQVRKDLRDYRAMPGGNAVPFEWRPRLGERNAMHGIDAHYFYQGQWAFEKILASKTPKHVDVGAEVNWLGVLTRITNVTSVELRPLPVHLDNFTSVKGDILQMPFTNGEVSSLSCLHVAEHIGLGRYGDALDPLGTKKACAELVRVLAAGGNLYFSLPIGKERTVFNAHRIHYPATIIEYFSGLTLKEFSAVTDKGEYIKNADLHAYDNAKYSCGLFHFTKA